MTMINPYLNFSGNSEEAFNLYKSVFGGEFATIQRYKDMPDAGQMPEADRDKIMHIALPIGKGNVLMGSDAACSMEQNLVTGNNFNLSVSVGSEEEADRVFNTLSAGGEIKMPLQKTFWGSYFGMLVDSFGIQWMISFDENYA